MVYAEHGAGSPILLVHGWAAHGGFFDDLAVRLAASHRVLAPTLRGHPGSERGTSRLCIETLGDDLICLCETLELQSIVALGWSMGAMALWAAAPRLRERLAGLIVEDMSPKLVNDASWRFGLAGYAATDVAGTLAEINADWPAYVARLAPRMFAPYPSQRLVRWAVREMRRADPEAMAALWSSMAGQNFRASLTQIETPMLVVCGAESQVYPDAAAVFIAQTAPNAEHVAVAGAGHVPHLERPNAFFEHVAAFAQSVRRGDRKRGGARS